MHSYFEKRKQPCEFHNNNNKNFMAHFYEWGSIASRLESLRGGSLLFTTKSPEIRGTHFMDFRMMKCRVDLGVTLEPPSGSLFSTIANEYQVSL